MRNNPDKWPLTSNHWGTYGVETSNGRVKSLHDFSQDPAPSPIGHGIIDVLDGPTRIDAPMVREGWLKNGPGHGEGRANEPFVRVSWDEANRLVAKELNRVRHTFGNQSIYAGSYGWASAGRFHHAQSQIHRFLNCIGGYTKSKNTYSFAAGEVLVPHVLGGYREFVYPGTSWQSIIDHAELLVAFGGVPVKNGQIAQGGVGRHRQSGAVEEAAAAGVQFVNISPMRNDTMAIANAQWIAPRPSTDTAILLGLMHTLLSEQLYDQAFLDRYTVGFGRFTQYLDGSVDGIAKTAEWASQLCEVDAETLRALARRMANNRTMISASWSLTRQDHGEQPFWAAIGLACMLGQIGKPGCGIGFGYSAVNSVGNEHTVFQSAALPQGTNPVNDFIPVARIADMLLEPGSAFEYNGHTGIYPDTKLVYWAGGNPFHHHQDLNRLKLAWQRPDTVISHEWCWNALAKHSDIVLPCATSLEREDVAITPRDGFIIFMEKALAPYKEARTDYDILSGISAELGVKDQFTEGRDAEEWVKHIYDRTLQAAAESDIDIPTLPELKHKRWFEIAPPTEPAVLLRDFRADPEKHPLNTPSGKIEIFSEVIESFNYIDCPPHPAWMEPSEWLGNVDRFPLHLISNQPTNKLHSQLDHGSVSRAGKINNREPVIINPFDADARGIKPGDTVRVFNDRGCCFCGAVLDENIRRSVIVVSTGAWFDPHEGPDGPVCKHGNPNVLTLDKGTSSLAQGPTAHSCLGEIEKAGSAPAVTAFEPPTILDS